MNKKTSELSIQTEIKGSQKAEEGNKRLKSALIRASAAFLVAVIMVSITGFAFIDLIRGPKETFSVQTEETGAFVKSKVYAIIGNYSSDEYVLVPMDGKLVTVHFTKRYLKSIKEIEAETQDYLNGIKMFDKYVNVQGTVEKLDENLSTQMYEWFDKNKDWMVEKQVISDASDYSDYLADAILTVDTVKSLNQNLVFVLTGLAALLILYVLVELILMAAGFYLDKSKKETIPDKVQVEKQALDVADKNAEDNENPEKCINNEIDSENIDSPDVEAKDGTEEPEGKE